MMAVVIHHGESFSAVPDFKAPLGTAEGFQGILNARKSHSHLGRQGDGGEGVAHVVPAGNA